MSRATKLKIVGPVCVIGGIVMVIAGSQESAVASRLKDEGVTVSARVLGQTTLSGRRGSKTYKIIAEYEPKDAGRSIRQEFSVPRAKYEASEAGEPISVRYLASDPDVAEIDGAGNSGIEKIGTGVLLAIVGAVMSFFVYRKKREKPVAAPA